MSSTSSLFHLGSSPLNFKCYACLVEWIFEYASLTTGISKLENLYHHRRLYSNFYWFLHLRTHCARSAVLLDRPLCTQPRFSANMDLRLPSRLRCRYTDCITFLWKSCRRGILSKVALCRRPSDNSRIYCTAPCCKQHRILFAGRILQGLSAAVVGVIGLAPVMDTIGPEDVSEAMGYVRLSMNLAILLGPMLSDIVHATAGYEAVFSWRSDWWHSTYSWD